MIILWFRYCSSFKGLRLSNVTNVYAEPCGNHVLSWGQFWMAPSLFSLIQRRRACSWHLWLVTISQSIQKQHPWKKNIPKTFITGTMILWNSVVTIPQNRRMEKKSQSSFHKIFTLDSYVGHPWDAHPMSTVECSNAVEASHLQWVSSDSSVEIQC